MSNQAMHLRTATALILWALLPAVQALSQEPAQAPAAAQAQAPAAAQALDAAQEQQKTDAPGPSAAPAKPGKPVKKGKVPYTGPTTIVVLAATPMLDSEGKQRLDPDGKPMFNPPVKQQRDKYGHPLFDDKGEPVLQTATELGFDDRGKKIHEKKEKVAKMIAVSISRGTLTVDGMIGQAALNYDISDFKYVYLFAPWIGTVVVSNTMFPGAKAQPNGFDQHTLTVIVEEHTFQVYSDKVLLGKKPAPAYVLVDREFKLPAKTPVMGYGATLRAPYNWPGAKQNPETKAFVKAPPVPVSLRPTAQLPPCPAGQMRARVVLPGESADAPPCVLIAMAIAATPDKPSPAADAKPATPAASTSAAAAAPQK